MAAFDTLHEKVRRWIWQQKWEGLRDVQERAIPILLAGDRDLIIMAPTAGGKTEAAFLPILSRLVSEPAKSGDGFQAIYVSPMRALINDQFGRMDSLCADMDIEVTKWHGDVSASVKAKARKNPSGIVLITPESLEALLVRRGKEVGRLFLGLKYVVIDEMHVFLDDPRGKQLQSILHRIDLASNAQPARVGLSATLADGLAARSYLRPLNPERVEVLPPGPGAPSIKLQVRGYVRPSDFKAPKPGEATEDADFVDPAEARMTKDIFNAHRGHRSLIFAGARNKVETLTVGLSEMGQAAGVPEEFFAHHGNLSKEHREDAESRMKDRSRPASIVCTTTLELGIDVGDIEMVAQLGPGHTVSGMRQRLGRSGRRPGQHAVMRVYVTEMELADSLHPIDALRAHTVQTIAMLRLMQRGWNEPSIGSQLNLSTLLHQIMALVGQHGGATAAQIRDVLLKSGTFSSVDVPMMVKLLKRMGDPEVGLLEQASDGTLLPGQTGERLLESRDIFSVFISPEEYKVVTDTGRMIGQVPSSNPMTPGSMLILGGRRWKIIEIDSTRKELSVRSARGGTPPIFSGDPVLPAEEVVKEMRAVWENFEIPPYLDPTAKELLVQARIIYDRLGLRNSSVARHNGQILLFPWVGEHKNRALVLALIAAGLEPQPLGIAISVPEHQEAQLVRALNALANGPTPDPLPLAALVSNKSIEKFDLFLGEDLLAIVWATDRLDCSELHKIAERLMPSVALSRPLP